MSSKTALLEVIALGAEDAERAQEGGADRLELVANMAKDGLTPSEQTVRDVLAATDLPVRVMLRAADGFAAGDLDALRADAARLVAAGAREFVFGFLTDGNEVDVDACRALLKELDGRAWTFHRAIDRARDPLAAYDVLTELGCDTVLAAGSPHGVGRGLSVLQQLARRTDGPALLVGGGLRAQQVHLLRAGGVRGFHVGSAVRRNGWPSPVDVAAVREWAERIKG
ncbi:copper homeostasis protein CutC [Amycolatopsis sp. FDAARGOS 1241]|uniref:copper homeostasis protein CutC n=1 Tax=Amycolatopsis sp. FDAARGOS 1241 TaxID=2778070 RepID=UPI001951B42A|nr:copper homeostasis protein CutC [Amycolatopsis sp. FDAARGOS 1241]QRP46740.1 copper homeostasis protein CutC [Amycolatopsis sp. FDAARGOS 1241]